MITQLPLELRDEIIEYLAQDNESLLNCSLTSRALLTSSQKQLFSRVIIRSPTKVPESDFVSERLFELGRSARQFRSLIDASPHIATFVQSFQIFDMERSFSDNIFGKQEEWLSKDQDIPVILPRLCQLKSLVVHYAGDINSNWYKVSVDFLSSLANVMQLPSLAHVSLDGAPMNLITRSLSPNLKHCSVGGTPSHYMGLAHLVDDPRLDSYLQRHQTQTATDLFSLRIYSPIIQFFLSDSSTSLQLSRLRKLVVGSGRNVQTHVDTQKLLKLCAHSLQEFAFTPCYNVGSLSFLDQDLSTFVDPIDIAQLTALRNLRVHLEFLSDDRRNSLIWFDCFLRGCSGTNNHLEEVTVLVVYQSRKLGTDFDLISNNLRALGGEKFPVLRVLNFVLVVRDEDERELVPFAVEGSEDFWNLKQKPGLQFHVAVCRSMYDEEALHTFAPNPRWEPALDTADFWARKAFIDTPF